MTMLEPTRMEPAATAITPAISIIVDSDPVRASPPPPPAAGAAEIVKAAELTLTPEVTPSNSTSIALRDATASDHRSAESNPYLDALLGGDLDRNGYARLAAQHWHIYRALEQVADEVADDPVGSAFITDSLVRLPTLETDLAFLLGDEWRDRIDPLPATVAYADRLIEIGGWVGGIVAHHYTRYLGDLSGGIFIGKRLEKIYEFGDGPGIDFYEFDDIDDANEFKKAYRVALDNARWDADEKLRIIDEARIAYGLNIDVFDDLGREMAATEVVNG